MNLLRKLNLFILPILLLLWLPISTYAQDDPEEDRPPVIDWQELRTEYFIIVYAANIDYSNSTEVMPATPCECGIAQAQLYAAFIDNVYLDLFSVFNVELEIPINLQLFPTNESYYEINPLAEQIPGVVAHALNNREEIAIALPRMKELPEDEVFNNIRHELTHFFASFLSDSKLNPGFQEGIAQYLEKPTALAKYNPAILEIAYNEGTLLPWSDLSNAEQVLANPDIGYPQALSLVAFLIDRYGFATFIEFIKASSTEPGYRSALELAYKKSADELETEWLNYLPEYFAGRWQINSIYAYDLSRVTDLVERGAYSDAETELIEVISLLESTDQTETLAQAEILLARSHQGQAVGILADETRQALTADDYALTIDKAYAAIATYQNLGYEDRIPELQDYIQRAELGQIALLQLDEGQNLLTSFRFPEADQQIYEATVILQSLNNQTAAQRGEDLLIESKFRQRLLAYAMLAIGAILLIFNGIRRVVRQFSANPLEVEYS